MIDRKVLHTRIVWAAGISWVVLGLLGFAAYDIYASRFGLRTTESGQFQTLFADNPGILALFWGILSFMMGIMAGHFMFQDGVVYAILRGEVLAVKPYEFERYSAQRARGDSPEQALAAVQTAE